MSLEIKNVGKTFSGSAQPVLDIINLNIAPGEFVCLLGSSGCGKSTLLNLIAGLDHPTAGQILHNGSPVIRPGTDRSYLFQEPALFPWLNVIDNIKFGMRINGVDKAEQEKRASHYLQMVNLEAYRDYRVHELSGGMKQRVALARALTIDSDVLLMDEPFAALDSHTKTEMRAHLLDIWERTGKTILFVTHSIKEAFMLADRVIVLSTHPTRIIQEYCLSRPRDIQEADIQEMIMEAEASLAKEVTSIAS